MQRRIKRIALFSCVGSMALLGALLLWAWLSPLPVVLLLRHGGAFKAPAVTWQDARVLLNSGKVELRRGIEYAPPSAQGCKENTLDLYVPRDAPRPLPILAWIHGGGFIAGSAEGLEDWLPLVVEHGYAAIAIEYCKAPEQRYPGQTQQTLAAIEFVRSHAGELQLDPARLVIGGDSAGAHIAAQSALAIVDPRYAKAVGLHTRTTAGSLRGTLLFSGTYNFLLPGRENVDASSLSERMAAYMRWAYLGEREPDPSGAARYTTLQNWVGPGFPPTLIVAGNGDPLAQQSMRMADALRHAGVATEWNYVEDVVAPVPHEFQFDLARADARQVLQQTIRALERWKHPED